MDVKSLLIGALFVAVAALGYLYYESQKTEVEVDIGAGQIGRSAASLPAHA